MHNGTLSLPAAIRSRAQKRGEPMRVSRSAASTCPQHRSTTYAARGRRALAVAAATVALAAPAAHADDGFDVDSTSRYVLQAKEEVVRATMTMTVRNERPSYRTGNYIQYFYLPSITIPVPAEAAQLTAVSDGAPLSVTREPTKDPSTALATIHFPSNLLYGQSRTVTVSFVLKGEKPRSKNQTRVGPGYATFAVYGRGDAGQNTVQVVLPASMSFDATTDAFDDGKGSKSVTYTATADTGGSGFWAVVSARDLDIARTRTVQLGDQDVEVLAYSDDKRWLRFVASRMTSGVPVLEELVGTPWPGGLTTVREDLSVNVRGYDGWFDSSEDSISIGESSTRSCSTTSSCTPGPRRTSFEERWLYEGIAQDLAARAVTTQGDEPARLKPASATSKQAVPLNTWGDAGGRAQPTDGYGYPASYRAMKALLDGMDDDTRSMVLAAAIAGQSAYAVSGETRLTASRTGWRRFLDLVQVLGHDAQRRMTHQTPPAIGMRPVSIHQVTSGFLLIARTAAMPRTKNAAPSRISASWASRRSSSARSAARIRPTVRWISVVTISTETTRRCTLCSRSRSFGSATLRGAWGPSGDDGGAASTAGSRRRVSAAFIQWRSPRSR